MSAQELKFDSLLLRELHHRFANSLQLLSSVVGSFGRAHPDPDRVRDVCERIAAMGAVHRYLSEQEAGPIDLIQVARDICPNLAAGFGRDDVRLIVKSRGRLADRVVQRGLSLILVELLTNALKHGGEEEPVLVEIEQCSHFARLTVSNAAKAPYVRAAPRIATELVESLGGWLEVRMDPRVTIMAEVPLQARFPSSLNARQFPQAIPVMHGLGN